MSAETDTFSAVVVQDIEGDAVEDGNDRAGEAVRKGTCETRSDRTAVISQIGLLMARLMAVFPD
jgi:hypothetical protein